jgi:hypothetical protein
VPERPPSALPVELVLLREAVGFLRAAADRFERLLATPAAREDAGVVRALELASAQSEASATAMERVARRWLLRPLRRPGSG